jgi:hypothetical protein
MVGLKEWLAMGMDMSWGLVFLFGGVMASWIGSSYSLTGLSYSLIWSVLAGTDGGVPLWRLTLAEP